MMTSKRSGAAVPGENFRIKLASEKVTKKSLPSLPYHEGVRAILEKKKKVTIERILNFFELPRGCYQS
jgi:hypothetical protein